MDLKTLRRQHDVGNESNDISENWRNQPGCSHLVSLEPYTKDKVLRGQSSSDRNFLIR